MVEKAENTKDWWTKRYQTKDQLYGSAPSSFLEAHMDFLQGKRILDAGCGEGGNAVFLAGQGCQVDALDFAEPAIQRGRKLADDKKTKVNFKIQDLDFYLPELMVYDAVVVVNFHPALQFLKNVSRGLKKDGLLLIEAYLTDQLNIQKHPEPVAAGLEFFECFKPNEILRSVSDYKTIYYDERPKKGVYKVFCIVQKQSPI